MVQATLSRREAAERLGIHYNSMRKWEKQYAELLQPTKVVIDNVEQVRIPVEGVERLLAAKEPAMPRRNPRSNQFANNPTARELAHDLELMRKREQDLRVHCAELEAENKGLREQKVLLETQVAQQAETINAVTGVVSPRKRR
jgi:hypothetical protein